LLLPQRNQVRDVVDLSGLWQFQLDPKDEREAGRWFDRLPAPRPIAVPCSWNELFDDARDYLGLGWFAAGASAPKNHSGLSRGRRDSTGRSSFRRPDQHRHLCHRALAQSLVRHAADDLPVEIGPPA
jgi:hypothetical protein